MDSLPVKKRTRKIIPSARQIKATQLLYQGYPASRALREAGYSRHTVSRSTAYFKDKKGFGVALVPLLQKLEDKGINSEFMAKKFGEWLEAKKIDHSHTESDKEVPDYETQLKAGKLLFERQDKLMGVGEGRVKRKLTVEEFVTGEDEK